MEFEVKGKFLNMKIDLSELRVIRAQNWRAWLIEFVNPYDKNVPLLCTNTNAFGHLAEFLGIKTNLIKQYVRNENVVRINKIIQDQAKENPRVIQINSAFYKNAYWISLFASEKYVVIPFKDVGTIVFRHFPDAVETKVGEMVCWEKQIKVIENLNNQFDIRIRITSGRNNKNAGIKVIPSVRVSSCDNSFKCLEFDVVKHVGDWQVRLRNNIVKAVKILNTVEHALEESKRALSLEDALKYVDELSLPVRKEEKDKHIRTLLKQKIRHEFKTNPNYFGLSQALSNVGTHDDPVNSTDHTLEVLQLEAFNVLTM